MKLIVAIVQDYDASVLLRALTIAGFRATHIGSTGGFLRTGNATLLIGVEDVHAPRVLALFADNCRERVEDVPPEVISDLEEWFPARPVAVQVGGATVFVLNVVRFERMVP